MKLLLLILFPLLLYSSNITTTMSYYETNKTFNQTSIQKVTFKPLLNSYLNKGFTKNTIWIKINITNNADIALNKVLHLDNPTISYIRLYDKNKLLFDTGSLKKKSTKDKVDINYAFDLNLTPNATTTYFLKLQSKHTLSTRIFIDDIDIYNIKSEQKKIFLIFFFGFIIAIIIYNLGLLLILNELKYFTYIIFQSTTLLLFLAFSGLGSYLLWGDYGEINKLILKNFDDLSIIFGLLFIQQFLHIEKYSKYLNYLILFVITLLIITLLKPLGLIPTTFVMYIMFLGLFTILFISIYGVYKQIETSQLFLFGWMFLILGSSITLLTNFGILPKNFFTIWGIYIGLMLEAIIFSIALAKKIQTLQKEKEQILSNLSKILQKKVKKRTKKLKCSLDEQKLLSQELVHRTKNSLQIISSFIQLEMMNKKNSPYKNSYKSLNNKVLALSELHQFFNSKGKSINIKAYITSLVNNLFYLKPKTCNIDFYININEKNISIDHLSIIGLLINEIVTNSFKHAFNTQKNGTITILLKKEENYTLTIGDSGKGFNFEKKLLKSIGLKLIYKLAIKQLNSTFNFKNHNGSWYTFIFKENTHEKNTYH